MEEKKNQLSINITPDHQEGVFANMAIIAHTPTEFVLDFAQIMPGVKQANVVRRIVVTPDQAKKLLGALQHNVMQYEKMYGPIQTPGAGPIPGSTLPISFDGSADA